MRIKVTATDAIQAISNPVAFRILAEVGKRGSLTTAELAHALRDVPIASLYRKLGRLRKSGVLCVISERQARGAVERTYALASRHSAVFSPADVRDVPVAQLRAAVRNFIASLAADVSTYIASRSYARNRLRVQAGLSVCKLTDAEYLKTVSELNAVIERAKSKSAGKHAAKRRYFYLIALPESIA